MEKDDDETNNDECSRPNTSNKQEKEKSRAETTDECTPASSQIQTRKESGGGQSNVPSREKRKVCSHILRKAALQDANKASERGERPVSIADQDWPGMPIEGDENLPDTSDKQKHSVDGDATEIKIQRTGTDISFESSGTGFLRGQGSSISRDSSIIELIEQLSAITQQSFETELLKHQSKRWKEDTVSLLSPNTLKKTSEVELTLQPPDILKTSCEVELTPQPLDNLEKSSEVELTPQPPDNLEKSSEVELTPQPPDILEKSSEVELTPQPPDILKKSSRAELTPQHPNVSQKRSCETDVDNLGTKDTDSVGQCSIIEDKSEIKLIERRSSFSSHDSSTIEFLIGQLSNITTISMSRTDVADVGAEECKKHMQESTSSSDSQKSTCTVPEKHPSVDDSNISDESSILEERSNSQERKRTRSEGKAEPLPPKKPRLEFEDSFDGSADTENRSQDDGISMGVSFKTNDDAATTVTIKPLTPKPKESLKPPNTTTDRKMKKPKHPKRVPILLETPVTEKFTVFMKNDKWKVVGGGMQGWRIRMEDAHVTLLETPMDPTVSFFGVFDGHGGNEVSNFVARHLYKFILQSDRFHRGDIDFAIKEGYMNIDNYMRENDIGKFRQGTTAVTLMIKDQTVYCANVGDSRAIAVINGEVVPLSVDQKPTLPEEAKRIGLAGLPILNNRVSGGLAMSRSLGDFRYKSFRHLSSLQQPVIAQPEIIKKSLNDTWEFVVLACDGIWDVMTNDLVAAFIKDKIKNGICLNEICESLFMKCLAPSAFFPNKGCDNMTAVIILFSEQMTKSTCLHSVTVKEGKEKGTVNG